MIQAETKTSQPPIHNSQFTNHTICIFNPEHDLCLAKGRAHYVPPRSAVEFALRDAALMRVLYPGATCLSVYDPQLHEVLSDKAFLSEARPVVAWGWDAVVKHELLKRGAPEALLPSDDELARWRDLQHRSSTLPLQPDCRAVASAGEVEALLRQQPHWVLKAPWSGAGRGLRWVHGALNAIDRDWLAKVVATQRCAIAEPRREVEADFAFEYRVDRGQLHFEGYSLFTTGGGVYRHNVEWSDDRIAAMLAVRCDLAAARRTVEAWLASAVAPHYRGPLGVDLMLCADGSWHVAEMNLRHTMGMVAHARVVGRP